MKASLLRQVVKECERRYILAELVRNNWKIQQTARDLGITRRCLRYKIVEHKIERPARVASIA